MQNLLNQIADILLVAASLGAAAYCMVLSRRLKKLGSFDKGIGSAIAVLSAQVDEMKTALREAKAGSDGASENLNDLVRQARDISAELEMMIAACHDFAETAIDVQSRNSTPADLQEKAADRTGSGGSEVDFKSAFASVAHRDRVEELPVFGSRRGGAADQGTASPEDAVAVFRHRRTADA
jgi:methyl-accepting chemotaxis protein